MLCTSSISLRAGLQRGGRGTRAVSVRRRVVRCHQAVEGSRWPSNDVRGDGRGHARGRAREGHRRHPCGQATARRPGARAEGRRSAMGDGRQKLAAGKGGADPLHEARRSDETAGDVQERWRVVGETARGGDLYTSSTRQVRRCEAPSPKGPRQTR